MNRPDIAIAQLLNAQTGQISWPDLARHFARGVVVCVNREKDLLEAAECLVRDQAQEVDEMYRAGVLHRADDEDAIRWHDEGTVLWAVVVAPWVLVQEA